VAGSLAYLGLARHVHGASRFRIVLLASSLLLWVLSGLLAELAAGEMLRFVAIVVLGLLTAGTVALAYFPPPPVARWLAAA
jgi:hypothetical protein